VLHHLVRFLAISHVLPAPVICLAGCAFQRGPHKANRSVNNNFLVRFLPIPHVQQVLVVCLGRRLLASCPPPRSWCQASCEACPWRGWPASPSSLAAVALQLRDPVLVLVIMKAARRLACTCAPSATRRFTVLQSVSGSVGAVTSSSAKRTQPQANQSALNWRWVRFRHVSHFLQVSTFCQCPLAPRRGRRTCCRVL